MEKNWYSKHYKKILILPAVILAISLFSIFQFINTNGDIVNKDVSITGGTTVTVFDENVDPIELKSVLTSQFPDVVVRGISDIRTGKQQAFFVETKASSDEIIKAIEDFVGYKITQENSSVEFTGEAISSSFYKQLRLAVFVAFAFMAFVVFLIFKTPVPSVAVILSAFADIVMTIATINFFGLSLSIGGIVALLMLIGYSVDTDILLTTRVLRKTEDDLNQRIFSAFKTGMTMTLTSIVAIAIALIIIYSFSDVLRQIFIILLIGLGFDILNTWTTNASILRWYVEAKK